VVEYSYSSGNAPYFTQECAEYIAYDLSARHLLTDLPSVDREDDQGQLIAHRLIFGCEKLKSSEQKSEESQVREDRRLSTVTELANLSSIFSP